MRTNQLENAGLKSNSLEKTLLSNALESKRLFHGIRELSITKFILGHVLRENNYVIIIWRKKKRKCVLTIVGKFQIFKLHNTKANHAQTVSICTS